jgi:TonB-linked SusC/RagA family outer membrane protein
VNDDKLTLKIKNITIQKAIERIQDQSEYDFFYRNVDLEKIQKKVTVTCKEKSIDEVLSSLFQGTELTYKILKQDIVIFPIHPKKPGNDRVTQEEQKLQQIKINGKVLNEKGEALPGVNILVKGTSRGSTTDLDGNYSINVEADATLVFSYVGYQNEKIKVNGRHEINLALERSITMLKEVVAIGYGKRQKKDISGSVSSMLSNQLEKITSKVSPEMALQGNVTGVRIRSGGGSPFARNEIRIRGINTWGSASPLIIIDGIPITEYGSGVAPNLSVGKTGGTYRGPVNIMTLINPNDIKSISVLKDAAAAAVYGMRASNGVILIETRSGQETEEELQVNFSLQYGIKNVPRTYDLLNVDEYVNLTTEAYKNNPDRDLPSEYDPASEEYLGDMPTVDWQGEYLNKDAITQNYDLQFSGNTEKSNYFFSLGYTNDENLVMDEKHMHESVKESNYNGLKRYSIKSNIETRFTDFLRAGLNLNGIWEEVNNLAGLENWVNKVAEAPPWQPVYGDGPNGYAPAIIGDTRETYDPKNKWGNSTTLNIFGANSMKSDKHILYRALGKAFIEFEPIRNLTIRGRLSGDFYRDRRNFFRDIDDFMFNPAAKNPLDEFGKAGVDDSEGEYEEMFKRNKNFTEEIIIKYDRSFGLHNFNFLLNGSHQHYSFELIRSNYNGLHYDDQIYWGINNQQDYISAETYKWENAIQGYVGRIDYNYNSRYYADVTLRYDGSSKFAKGNRWDYFPGFSLAWRMSDEPFMSGFDWLTDMKIYGGWGKLGNHQIANYGYVALANENATVNFGSDPGARRRGMGNVYWGVGFNEMPNKELEWEKTYTTNLGIDLILFNSFTSNIEIYHKKTTDLLTHINLPYSTGLEDPPTNFGSVVNRGADIQLGYRDEVGEFWYNINSNISFVHNEVTKIKGNTPFGGNANRVREGYPLFYLRGYRVGGIFQSKKEVENYQAVYNDVIAKNDKVSPGDLWFKDIRGNPENENQSYSGKPDHKVNQYDKAFLGKTFPGFTYGFNAALGFRSFDLYASFYGEGDVKGYNWNRANLMSMANADNQWAEVKNRWTPENPDTDLPRAVIGDPAGNARFSDRFVEDASYLRLQNFQIGYNFSAKTFEKFGVGQRMRFWIGCSNVFTLTKWGGLDPSTDGLPNPRTFIIGVNATF